MRRIKGFTLLELLIGLTLLGFIMALLFGGFRLATKSRDAVEQHAGQNAREQASIAFVRRVLGSVQPLRLTRLPGRPLAFAGTTDRLVLVAPLAEQAGLRTIELAFEPGRGAFRLLMRNGPPPYGSASLLDPVAGTDSRTLIDGLENAGFDYFGSLRPQEPARWHTAWDNPIQLPALIRMKLLRRDGHPVDLVVATTIDADPAAQSSIVAGPAGILR